MADAEDLQPVVDQLMATAAVQGASIQALLLLCRALARKCGVTKFDGIPLDDWFQREKLRQLEEVLIRIEDRDAAYAALLQSMVDASRQRLDDSPPHSD